MQLSREPAAIFPPSGENLISLISSVESRRKACNDNFQDTIELLLRDLEERDEEVGLDREVRANTLIFPAQQPTATKILVLSI